MAFPESSKLELPFAEKFWPKFSPVECANCTELYGRWIRCRPPAGSFFCSFDRSFELRRKAREQILQ
jgi:hypothetical protein